MLKKVFGIISYLPDADTDYHKYVRKQRMKRCTELFQTLNRLWPNIDIMVIAQNWQDFRPTKPSFNITIFEEDAKLGILSARKTLRQKFLESKYDYLIMLDDDAVIHCTDPNAYIREIDEHPSGIGVVSHKDNALVLLAISKSIYSQIDLPEVDAERGQGFEGSVFVARCFEQFPEQAFDFITDIKDTSSADVVFPSTWSVKSEYEHNHMIYATDALVAAAKHKSAVVENNNTSCIDAVIPYVDCTDPSWITSYTGVMGDTKFSPHRFRSWDTLKYLLRGIERYMPFIRNVVLIVADQHQIPDWVNQDKVTIVCHKDFIPSEYLPTFNSCTIESFLFNITKLSDRFIYFNDDTFPINDMSIGDFFTGNTPHLRFREHLAYLPYQIFNQQCRTSLDVLTNVLSIDKYPQGELVYPEHTAMPMLKSTVAYIGKSCISDINESISTLREPKNINQYIYHYYQYFTEDYIEDICPYLYAELNDDLTYIGNTVLDPQDFRFICLNDMGDISDYDRTRRGLLQIFECKFPSISKYEICL